MKHFGKHFGLKAMAVAAGLSLAAVASPASAAFLITLNSANMDGTYTSNINYGSIHETAYSNGVTFNVTDVAPPNATYDLFGFCIDIFHNMYLGGLGYLYESTYGDAGDPLTTDYGNPPVALTGNQKNAISTLVDIGFVLNEHSVGAATSIKTAAIQSAIWEVIHPGSITLNNGGATVDGIHTYQNYFDTYRNLNGSGDRIFTITDVRDNPAHQSFAVGWPVSEVPEASSWALMLTGFLGAGVMLRRRKSALA